MYHLYLQDVKPLQDISPDLLSEVLRTCEEQSQRRYRTQHRILSARREAAPHILSGLIAVTEATSWSFLKSDEPLVSLCLPLSQHGYTSGPLQHLSHVAVTDVVNALVALSLVEVRSGYYAGDQNFQSQLLPTPRFLERYGKAMQWQKRKLSKTDPIVLKNYDPRTKKKYPLTFADTPEIRRMRKNIRKINQALLDSAIALAVDEFQLWRIRQQMARKDYWSDLRREPRMLSFQSVELRRVFARKSFKLGGRFYGGWWQSIPSKYRPYITINGQTTIELDYSTLHLTLVYAEFGEQLPSGDLYDFGYDDSRRAEARRIFKTTINALINDTSGAYLVPKEDQAFLGLTNAEIRKAIIKKHPLIKRVIGTGRGLRYQYIDSQIAECVMLKLLDQGIVCLPVHDSFIVIAEYESLLRMAMIDAFSQIVGGDAQLKDPEVGQSGFEPVTYPSGELDLTYLRNREATSPYHVYHKSFYNHQ